MRIDCGPVQLHIGEGPQVQVQYRATESMISAATAEACRLGLNIDRLDIQKLLQAALNAA